MMQCGKLNNIIAGRVKKIREKLNPEDERSKSRKNIIFSTYANNVTANLIGGNFYTGLLLSMKADDAFFGMLTIMSYVGNLLTIFSPLFLERFVRRKNILIASRGFIYFLNIIVIGIVPLIAIPGNAKLNSILVVTLLVNVISAISSPGFSIWHIKSIPENIRTRYYSFVNITNTLVVYPVAIGTSMFMDRFKANGTEIEGITILRIAAVGVCVLDLLLLLRVREYPNVPMEKPPNLADIFIMPFKSGRYLVTVAMICLYTFSAQFQTPYYSVYLLKDLKLSYTYLNIISMLSLPASLVFYPVWARIIQAISWFRSIFIIVAVFSTQFFIGAFVTKQTLFLYPVSVLIGCVVSPGIGIAFSNLPYINLPRQNQTNYLGFYATANNLTALLTSFIAKEFIVLTERLKITILGTGMQNKQYIYLVTAVMLLASAAVIFMLIRKFGAQEDTSSTEIEPELL